MRTLSERPSNLPHPLSSFIGREGEIRAVCELFISGARLVTLTGPGGVGKTRLALAVAEQLAAACDGEVVFVSLAPISDHRLVIPTIARSLGVEESTEAQLIDRLTDYLQDRRVAIVLDNVEHVLEAAPEIAMLLQASAELLVLATGREPLRLQGEYEYAVSPLALPGNVNGAAEPDEPERAAVQLFVERARQASHEFGLHDENRFAVREICRRLDGLPLALELAAARLKTLSSDELLCRLDQPLAVLTGGPRDLPERQQTMRATIQWSYDLLTRDEQRLFRHMSVFSGGGTLAAIESVSGDQSPLESLASLVEKSLVRRINGSRYDMLEPVRQFAREQLLLKEPEAICVRNRHARHYCSEFEGLRHRVDDPDGPEYLNRVEVEHDNIRAALNWYCESDQIELGLDLVGEIGMFWVLRSYVLEGQAFAESFLSHPCTATPTRARIKALWVTIWMNFRRREWDRAFDLANEVYCSARQIGFQEFIAHGLFDRGLCWRGRGEYEKTKELWDEALTIFRALDERAMVVRLLANYGQLYIAQGDLAQAKALLEEAYATGRANDLKISTALVLGALGVVALETGDRSTARKHHRNQLNLYIEINHHEGIANCLRSCSVIYQEDNQPVAAVRLLSAGVAQLERSGLGYSVALRHQRDVSDEFKQLRAMLTDAQFEHARAAGSAMTAHEATSYALEILSQDIVADPALPDGLTPRESEVLSLIAAGHSNRDMAEELYLSVRTVERHVSNIYRKIDAHNRTDATRYALQHNIIELTNT